MKTPLLIVLLAGLALVAWKVIGQRATLPPNDPTLKPPMKPNQPAIDFLGFFPKVLNALWNQPSQAVGIAPGTSYDPWFVRDSYDREPLDFAESGIY